MCTDTPQRYLRRILVSDFKQTKRWPIIPSLRRCQCSPPPAYLSMCTDTPQRYLRRILILDFKQKNAGRPFSFQNRFSLLWQPCSWEDQCEWHRMTRMTGPDCAVMCDLMYIHTYIHTYMHRKSVSPLSRLIRGFRNKYH